MSDNKSCKKIATTDRLVLRQISINDAEFIFRLLNEPSWIRYIGDKKIKNRSDAEAYIHNGPMKMYEEHGFGLFLAELKSDRTPIGLCGLIQRDDLKDADLGFAFLPAYWRKGYAAEAALAAIYYGKTVHDLSKLVAITLADNHSSVGLLKRLGFRFEHTMHLEGDDEELELYGIALSSMAKVFSHTIQLC